MRPRARSRSLFSCSVDSVSLRRLAKRTRDATLVAFLQRCINFSASFKDALIKISKLLLCVVEIILMLADIVFNILKSCCDLIKIAADSAFLCAFVHLCCGFVDVFNCIFNDAEAKQLRIPGYSATHSDSIWPPKPEYPATCGALR